MTAQLPGTSVRSVRVRRVRTARTCQIQFQALQELLFGDLVVFVLVRGSLRNQLP